MQGSINSPEFILSNEGFRPAKFREDTRVMEWWNDGFIYPLVCILALFAILFPEVRRTLSKKILGKFYIKYQGVP